VERSKEGMMNVAAHVCVRVRLRAKVGGYNSG
jgi:hypothetical protein